LIWIGKMSDILKIFLSDNAYLNIKAQYQYYRRPQVSSIAIVSIIILKLAGRILFRFEASPWQVLRKQHHYWFPHISKKNPRLGDVFRYLFQIIWLILFYPSRHEINVLCVKHIFRQWRLSYYSWLEKIPDTFQQHSLAQPLSTPDAQRPSMIRRVMMIGLTITTTVLLFICITQPFHLVAQFIFVMLLWAMAISINKIPGRISTLILVVLSVIVSSRYLWWRFTYTLIWDTPTSAFFGSLLIIADTYIWLVMMLGYFQTLWPLNRQPTPLPEDQSSWPIVDVFFATYNEDLAILKPGIYSALGLDWPKEKLNIYILDDGNRAEFKAFADEVGVRYIARPTHNHAKAGNINYALQHSHGELIAVFDCDFVITHTFLQLTVGWFFKDPKIAIVQTPHHFFSPDPFERNLKSFRQIPNENALFYGVIQDGNDTWNAAYFCGSAGIFRRTALEQIGGMAVESVTEDAHTSLRLQRLGYNSAYIPIPLAAGLATDSLAGHIGQRMRWARGMVQILRMDNPLLGRGLALGQRLCYFNAMLYFLAGIPRLIFFISPAAFLILNAYIVYAPGLMILLYALPHIIHASITNNRIQGKYRHYLWNEIYETVMAWYMAVPTTMALINPRKGTFNVTPKGDLIDEEHVDWSAARPYIVLLCINIAGLVIAGFRLISAPIEMIVAVVISIGWTLYNILILGGAFGVSIESKQRRKSTRVSFVMPAKLKLGENILNCRLIDYSNNGVGLQLENQYSLTVGEKVLLLLDYEQKEFAFPGTITYSSNQHLGILLDELSIQQNVDFIRCTFARRDIWTSWQEAIPMSNPIRSIHEILMINIRSYVDIMKYVYPVIHSIVMNCYKSILWVGSFFPRRPTLQRTGFGK
jgi:cellulose synthase (UDP-forming)